MSLVFFDACDSGLNKFNGITGSVSFQSGQGVYGGGAIYVPNNSTVRTNRAAIKWAETIDTVRTTRMSFWFRTAAAGYTWTSFSTEPHFYTLDTNNRAGHIFIMQTEGGRIRFDLQYVLLTSGSNEITGSTNPVIISPINLIDGKWHHISFSLKYADSGGVFSLRVDNKLFANFTGDTVLLGTPGNGINQFVFGNLTSATAGGYYIDDIAIWDSTDNGDGFADNFIPPQRIITLRPSADTAQAQSTPSTGSDRWSILKQPDANSMNGYVSLSIGKKDLYEIDDLSANANVRLLGTTITYASGQAGYMGNVRVVMTSNNVNVSGNSFTAVSPSYVTHYNEYKHGYIAVRDFGNSNIAWAQTSISGIQIGIENTGVP